MLLMSPSEAALSIGAKCGGNRPSDDDMSLQQTLRFITPRVEQALGVATLTRGTFVDHFYLGRMPTGVDHAESSLLLSNGFVVPGTVALTSPDGTVTAGADLLGMNDEYGVLVMNEWMRGAYSVTYQSGFDADPVPIDAPVGYDPESRVLKNVPDWMKAIVVEMMTIWYRTAGITPRASKDLSYGQVSQAIAREMLTRIYGRYMRPRAAVTFSDRMDRVP